MSVVQRLTQPCKITKKKNCKKGNLFDLVFHIVHKYVYVFFLLLARKATDSDLFLRFSFFIVVVVSRCSSCRCGWFHSFILSAMPKTNNIIMLYAPKPNRFTLKSFILFLFFLLVLLKFSTIIGHGISERVNLFCCVLVVVVVWLSSPLI